MSILFCSITKKLFFIFLCHIDVFWEIFIIKKFVVIMKIYAITTFFEISLHYTHIFLFYLYGGEIIWVFYVI